MTIKILVVDDDEGIHEIMDKAIRRAFSNSPGSSVETDLLGSGSKSDKNLFDVIVEHAYQGEEAVEKVKKAYYSGTKFDLIIMDVLMPPGINGIEAIDQICSLQEGVQFAICSAYNNESMDDIKKVAKKTKRTFVLSKPFRLKTFKDLLKEATSHNEEFSESVRSLMV